MWCVCVVCVCYSLAVLLAYLAEEERSLLRGLPAPPGGRCRAGLVTGTEALRTELLLESGLRLENPPALPAAPGRAEASVSLGVVKEPVLFRGMASRSSLDSFFSWAVLAGGPATSWEIGRASCRERV